MSSFCAVLPSATKDGETAEVESKAKEGGVAGENTAKHNGESNKEATHHEKTGGAGTQRRTSPTRHRGHGHCKVRRQQLAGKRHPPTISCLSHLCTSFFFVNARVRACDETRFSGDPRCRASDAVDRGGAYPLAGAHGRGSTNITTIQQRTPSLLPFPHKDARKSSFNWQ